MKMNNKNYWPDPRLIKPKERQKVTCEIKHDERFVRLLQLKDTYVLAPAPDKIIFTSFRENDSGKKIFVQGTGKIYLGSDKNIYGLEVIATVEEDARVKWTSPDCIFEIQNLNNA